jgi:PDZ domain
MRAENPEIVNCPSCSAPLIAGLRFCRMCGYRLGEGLDEYVPTQRLGPNAALTAAPPRPSTDTFAPRQTSSLWAKSCSAKRGGWWIWLTVAIVLLVGAGMVPISLMKRGGGSGGGSGPVITKSFLGVDGFEEAPGGGALIMGIAAPDTPVVRAGLIGGDVIKTFDGRAVEDDDAMTKILSSTPAGKSVEVVYVRDGVQATTTLTTIASKENPGLKVFDRRPGGAGNLGIDRGDLERVVVPKTNIYGAELGDMDRNGPAEMAGLHKGDIVIKFGDFLIRTPGDLRYRISEALPGAVVPVLVVRGAEQVEIPVKVGRSKD